MRRLAFIILCIAVTSLAAGCGAYGERYTGSEGEATGPDGEEPVISAKPFDAAARKAAGCEKLKTFESEGQGHEDDIKVLPKYKTNPPTSGPHYQVAVDWGIYDDEQLDQQTTHNLEHGHLVISYKGLEDGEVEELRDFARRNLFHLVLVPRDKNPKDGVYLSAWTSQMYCREPSAAALQFMVDEWRDRGPELFASDPGRGSSDET